MAMNDKSFEWLLVGEKLFADPKQIIFCLLLNRNTGPDAGVDKQIIAATEREIKQFQEFEVLSRKGPCQLISQPDLFVPIRVDGRPEPIG